MQIGKLPSSLNHIKTGHCFNQPLIGMPDCLETLIIGKGFNQTLSDLPGQLHKLEFLHGYQGLLEHAVLPDSLEYIIVCTCYNYQHLIPASFKGKVKIKTECPNYFEFSE